MLDLANVPESFLEIVERVVSAVLAATEEITSKNVMLVGAWCRDTLHAALGHRFPTSATRDLDLALALTSWETFKRLTADFPQVPDTGIRYRVADVTVDLLPFGEIEDPTGTVEPPTRSENPMSVWAFEEIYAIALDLSLSPSATIRLPSVPGYAAAKLAAWLDRSEWRETKDAGDLALILYWYAESPKIQNRLYETDPGNAILIDESMDYGLAAAHLLGNDILDIIGAHRQRELLARWPGDLHLLVRDLVVHGNPAHHPSNLERRRELIDALSRGLNTNI